MLRLRKRKPPAKTIGPALIPLSEIRHAASQTLQYAQRLNELLDLEIARNAEDVGYAESERSATDTTDGRRPRP